VSSVAAELSVCNPAHKVRLRQRFAYLALVFSTGHGNFLSWFAGNDECRWNGIRCVSGAVSQLLLDAIGLQGTIPEDVGLWTSLTVFRVNSNQLFGSLPSSIGVWPSLTTFNVGNNQLVGTIPTEVAKWSSIANALFHQNKFNGTMPGFGNNFCPKVTSNGFLWSDCQAPAKINCTCCNGCF
jgi:hypothetical protein